MGEYRLSRTVDEFSMLSKPYVVKVGTLRKRKADKVRPVDLGVSDGSKPGSILDWVEKSKLTDVVHGEKGKYSNWLILKFSDIKKGSRLTEECAAKLLVGEGLTSQEKAMFFEMLYNREKALAFDFSHCGKIHSEVTPPQVIKTVKHKPWQVPGFPVPKALMPIVVKMLQERLKNGVLEYCDGPY